MNKNNSAADTKLQRIGVEERIESETRADDTGRIDDTGRSEDERDYLLSSYEYELPRERIAQFPAERREQSRLMHLDRATGEVDHLTFRNIEKILEPGTLLVVNNSKVLPGRVMGRRETGGKVEFLLLTPLPIITPEQDDEPGWMRAAVEGLTKSSKRLQPGEVVRFNDDFFLVYEERGEFGRCRGTLRWAGNLEQLFLAHGETPLPPYIDRPSETVDCERYQTIYCDAAKAGSVAAPTAGLHFSHGVMERLEQRGVEWASVTLYVGYGTFSPVRADDIRDHVMHAEYYEISEESAMAIREAKAQGRPVVAVGTTAVRVLEGAFAEHGEIKGCSGWTNIYIYPGKPFHVVDGMLTNFHLPGSSLLMLVAAFTGRETILKAYKEAVTQGYRFFSYGDAMLLL